VFKVKIKYEYDEAVKVSNCNFKKWLVCVNICRICNWNCYFYQDSGTTNEATKFTMHYSKKMDC